MRHYRNPASEKDLQQTLEVAADAAEELGKADLALVLRVLVARQTRPQAVKYLLRDYSKAELNTAAWVASNVQTDLHRAVMNIKQCVECGTDLRTEELDDRDNFVLCPDCAKGGLVPTGYAFQGFDIPPFDGLRGQFERRGRSGATFDAYTLWLMGDRDFLFHERDDRLRMQLAHEVLHAALAAVGVDPMDPYFGRGGARVGFGRREFDLREF